MTDIEALSRRIATKMEPEPTWTYVGQVIEEDMPYKSDGGFWQRQLRHPSWENPAARSILEPEISMRLLKWLLEQENLQLRLEKGSYELREIYEDSDRDNYRIWPTRMVLDLPLDLPLAIARAAAKAMGLEDL